MGGGIFGEFSLIVSASNDSPRDIEHDCANRNFIMLMRDPRFFERESHCIGGVMITWEVRSHAGQATADQEELGRNG